MPHTDPMTDQPFRPDQRPDVEILVDGVWCQGELCQWSVDGDDNWSAQMNWRREVGHTYIDTFPLTGSDRTRPERPASCRFRRREGHIPQGQTRDSRGKAKARLLSDDGQDKGEAHKDETQNDDVKFVSPESRRQVVTNDFAGLSNATEHRSGHAHETHEHCEYCEYHCHGWTLS